MLFEIKDRLAQTMGLTVVEVRENGIVTHTESKKEYCNAYGFAHGGFFYTHYTIFSSAFRPLVFRKTA